MEMNNANLLWFFAFIFLAGGGNGFFGNRGPMGPAPASIEDVNNAVNNQSLQQSLNQLVAATANNNYETAQLLNQQSNMMMQNQNTNLINVIQGFNAVTQQLQNQTSALGQQINQLGYQLDSCCCGIKTQMLQDRLTDKTAEVVALQNKIDNRDQTQAILSNLGRFVAWAGSGAPATSSTVSG